MVDVDAVVDDGDDDGLVAPGRSPRLAGLDVLVVELPVERGPVVQVPLGDRDADRRRAPVLRDEVRHREDHLVLGRQRVGRLEQVESDLAAGDDHLLGDVWIGPPDHEPTRPQQLGAPRRAEPGHEAHDDLLVDRAQVTAGVVPQERQASAAAC